MVVSIKCFILHYSEKKNLSTDFSSFDKGGSTTNFLVYLVQMAELALFPELLSTMQFNSDIT